MAELVCDFCDSTRYTRHYGPRALNRGGRDQVFCNVCSRLIGPEYPNQIGLPDILRAIVKLYHALGVEPEND